MVFAPDRVEKFRGRNNIDLIERIKVRNSAYGSERGSRMIAIGLLLCYLSFPKRVPEMDMNYLAHDHKDAMSV